jgi:hypothetical protein
LDRHPYYVSLFQIVPELGVAYLRTGARPSKKIGEKGKGDENQYDRDDETPAVSTGTWQVTLIIVISIVLVLSVTHSCLAFAQDTYYSRILCNQYASNPGDATS